MVATPHNDAADHRLDVLRYECQTESLSLKAPVQVAADWN